MPNTNETEELFRKAVEKVRSHYPETVFPDHSRSLTGQSGTVARNTCDLILKTFEEMTEEAEEDRLRMFRPLIETIMADILGRIHDEWPEVEGLAREIVSLLVVKNADYGREPIRTTGIPGIVVRLSDKVERLRNLILGSSDNENPTIPHVKNEKIDDTFRDIAGYGILALLFMNTDYFGD